ncbi:MAG: hydroxyacid dehydrogenase [Armatimonadaceae bacterium]
MKLLHIAARQPNPRLFTPPFLTQLREFGELSVIEHGEQLPETEVLTQIRGCEVLLTGWGHLPVPVAIAAEPGSLRYICHLTGEMRSYIPPEIIRAGIPVTNWGDALALQVAEGAVTLLLACLKNLRAHIEEKRNGQWRLSCDSLTGTMRGLRVGIYGYGVIAQRFVELCRPFGARLSAFDPYVSEFPPDVEQCTSLNDLFAGSDAVVLHAGLTPETRHSIGTEQLALLRDNGILINTARGGLVDQDALFAELERGRLRAGLDVLDFGDWLPPDHPARQWTNVVFTSHQVSNRDWSDGPDSLNPLHEVCLDNLRRFAHGEPLRFRMDEARYERST